MADIKDLQFLDKTELLMRIAVRLEKARSNLELIKLVNDMVKKKPGLLNDAPPDVIEALQDESEMEERLLEMRSIIHWLMTRRE